MGGGCPIEACVDQLRTQAKLLSSASPFEGLVHWRISRRLADEAVAAWHREDGPGDLSRETDRKRAGREEAATLALMGQVIADTGVEDGDHGVFMLDAWLREL